MDPKGESFRFSIPDGKEVDPADVARQLGIPVAALPSELLEYLKHAHEFIEKDKAGVRQIIGRFYDEAKANGEPQKKLRELVDIGKFILYNTHPLQLVKAGESPDFILEWEGTRIGVEHTQLFNQTEQHLLGKATSFLEATRKLILKSHPKLVGLFNLFLDLKNIALSDRPFIALEKVELRPFARSLADYIISLPSNEAYPRPDFLREVVYYPKEDLILSLSEQFTRGELVTAALADRIEKKEAKIASYKKAEALDAYWLLIVYGGAGSSSGFFVDPRSLPTHFVQFDRIFLMDAFRRTIIEGQVIR